MDSTVKSWLFNLRLYFTLSCLCSLYILGVRLPQAYGIGTILGFSGALLIKLLPVFIGFFISAGLLVVSFTPRRVWLLRLAQAVWEKLSHQPAVNWPVFILLLAVFLGVHLGPADSTVDLYLPTLWLFGHLVLLASVFLHANWCRVGLVKSLVVTTLIYACVYQIAFTFVQQVSSYPLTMGFSEGSSYYFASLFFARRIYGVSLPLPVLDPARSLLQAVPFLISGLPLWVHRLWQALLWIGLIGGCGAALVRRLKLTSHLMVALVIVFAFLFFFQGPLYYHLALVAIIVLLGFNTDRPLQSSLVVLLASILAGLTRINWFPVPGMLAATLYVLERPLVGKSWLRYWSLPFVWLVAGSLVAFVVRDGYNLISKNPPEMFYSSLKYPFLWYRLWPNATYSPGICLGLLMTAFPVTAFIIDTFVRRARSWHILRSTALAVMLVALMVGGIVVSVRIGGGSNLHNLDAFWVLLLVVASYTYFDLFAPDQAVKGSPSKMTWVWLLVAVIVLAFPAVNQKVLVYQVPANYRRNLSAMQKMINKYTQQDGQVLLLTQTQMVTFNFLHGVTIQPEYERVLLMEMVMANNQAYLQTFDGDLKNHRYTLVILDRIFNQMQPQQKAFSDENNAWTLSVEEPLLTYYQIVATYSALGINVLTPCPTADCSGK